MVAEIKLRTDFDQNSVICLAGKTTDLKLKKKLVALGLVYAGSCRKDIAQITGVTPQAIRDWIIRFNECGLDGLVNKKPPGRSPKLNTNDLIRLKQIINLEQYKNQRKKILNKQVVCLVKDQIGIELTEPSISRIIKKISVSDQKITVS